MLHRSNNQREGLHMVPTTAATEMSECTTHEFRDLQGRLHNPHLEVHRTALAIQ